MVISIYTLSLGEKEDRGLEERKIERREGMKGDCFLLAIRYRRTFRNNIGFIQKQLLTTIAYISY